VLSDNRTAQSWSAFDEAQSAPGGVVARGARWSESALPALKPALMASWAIHAHYGLRGWGSLDGVPQGVLVPELAAGSPVSVVWGSDDATCDPAAAEVLCEALRAADLDVQQAAVSGAGHRMSEPRLASALASAAQAWVSALRRVDRF
jgi:proline iminopeptidase